jgi:hypothetical protein
VLVILAAAAACSPHDDSKGTDPLSQDRTLVARLQSDRDTRPAPLPAECGTVTVAAKPAIANQTKAKELTLQAQSEEMQGNVESARTLLRRAADLDGTSQSSAYHLARTNETLGDRAAAMAAYCRYLALAPSSAESAEARQRVAELSKPVTRVSGGSVAEATSSGAHRVAATTRRVTRERRTSSPKAAPRATVVQSAVQPAMQSTAQPPVATTETEVGATPDPLPTAEQTSAPSRVERRGPTRTQGAIVGAATGAIIGAATGRSVKGAVIGAAAGGLLGTVVGRGGRSWAPSTR